MWVICYQKALKKHGFADVHLVHNGADALVIAHALPATHILLASNLPVLSGVEAVPFLKRNNPQACIGLMVEEGSVQSIPQDVQELASHVYVKGPHMLNDILANVGPALRATAGGG